MRDAFIEATTALLADDPRTALVLADISADAFETALRRHPDRALNVGIREQLMVGVAGGLALTGLRPIVHSYAPFAVDRAYEQIKLDLGHQDAGAVIASVGASYDASTVGYTHHSPQDVALLDTLEGWTARVPGHRDEVPGMLRAAALTDDRVYLRLSAQENKRAYSQEGLDIVKFHDQGPLVIAVGPMLDPTLEALEELPATVAYTNTPRPFDRKTLRELAPTEVVVIEPYLAGTSSRLIAEALADRPHRSLHLGVSRVEHRGYGLIEDHAARHGLDAPGIRKSVTEFLGS